MKPVPIRWKFALWTALAAGLAIGVFATGTLLNLYGEQIEAVDLELAAEAKELGAALAEHSPDTLRWDQHQWLGWAAFGPDAQLRHLDSKLSEWVARAALKTGQFKTYRAGTSRWRAGAFQQAGVVLVVGYDLEEVHDIVRDLLVAYVVTLPLVLAVAALGGWWVAGRALAPVRALAQALEKVQAERLDQRVTQPAAEDEIRRLACSFNAMLDRLEKSFQQAKRFAADASHELRTPLTIMRSEIESLLRIPGLLPACEERLLSLQEEIARLDRITEQLLLLARFDASQVVLENTTVDFTRLVAEACEDADLLATVHQVTLATELAGNVLVRGDAHHLRGLLLNLLDNAAKYNDAGGTVRCTLIRADNEAVLRIANTGPGISAEQRPGIFQRFFRTSVSQSHSHGLGLSLSREIALAHGGSLTLSDLGEPGWTEFILRLPLAGE